MKNLANLLDLLETLLDEEKVCIIRAINDKNCIEKLLDISEKKRELLSELASFTKEEVLKEIQRIERLEIKLNINRELVLQNLKFIEDLFEAVFETTKTYSPEGSLKSSKEGLINKKV